MVSILISQGCVLLLLSFSSGGPSSEIVNPGLGEVGQQGHVDRSWQKEETMRDGHANGYYASSLRV